MKILQVVHEYPPSASGGAGVFVQDLAHALRDLGDEVMVFHRSADASAPDYSVDDQVRAGVRVFGVNRAPAGRDSFAASYRDERLERVFGEVLEREPPAVVHFHHLTNLSTGLVGQAAALGIPVVYTLHDHWLICQRGQFLNDRLEVCEGQSDDRCATCLRWEIQATATRRRLRAFAEETLPFLAGPGGSRIKRRLRQLSMGGRDAGPRPSETAAVAGRMDAVRGAYGRVDRFLAPSRHFLRRFEGLGLPRSRLEHVTYGIDVKKFAAARRPPGAQLRFGFVGSLIPPKGLHVLLEAFRDLDHAAAGLSVFGAPAPYSGYDDYASRLPGASRFANVTWHGAVSRERIGEAYAALDCLIVPSIWEENSPLVIHEALAAGVPVIASAAGGIPELVRDEDNGLLLAPRDPAALRQAIRRCINDRALLARLGMNARPLRDIRDAAQEHQRVYRDVSAGGPGARPGTVAATCGSSS